MSNHTMLHKYGDFMERSVYFYFIVVFYILGAFLIKQLFNSRLLDMRWLYPTQPYAPR